MLTAVLSHKRNEKEPATKIEDLNFDKQIQLIGRNAIRSMIVCQVMILWRKKPSFFMSLWQLNLKGFSKVISG